MRTFVKPTPRPAFRLGAALLVCLAGWPAAAQSDTGSDLPSDLIALTPHGGRAPGSPGHAQVAEFLRHRFAELGLTPGIHMGENAPTWDQELETKASAPVLGASLRYTPQGESGGEGMAEPIVIPAAHLDPHWATGSGTVEGPGVFTGYSIVSGPNGYMSFTTLNDLSGMVALTLRAEPMDEQGHSQWTSGEGWSFRASSLPKVTALSRRNAAAVVLITPPGAINPDAAEQQRAPAQDFHFEIPVLTISSADADELFAACDPEARTTAELRALADAEPIIQHLSGRFEIEVDKAPPPEAIHNIVGVLEGKGELASETVLLVANYDGPADMPAANDNASGVVAMLRAAELLTESYAQELDSVEQARSIVFLASGLGESGAEGLSTYLESVNPEHTPEPGGEAAQPVAAAIILDTLGRSNRTMLNVIGANSGEGMDEWLTPLLDRSIFEINVNDLRRSFGEQLTTAFDAGIPTLMFSTGSSRASGGASDTIDRVDPGTIADAADLIADVALELAFRDERFASDKDAGNIKPDQPQHRRPVRLGVQPVFQDEEDGVLIQRVFDDTSASDAGLLAGDRITQWDDEPIVSMDDFVLQLSLAKPGDMVTFTLDRDGQPMTVEVTLRAPGE